LRQQILELILGTLLCSQCHHHADVYLSQMMLLMASHRSAFGHDNIVDEQRCVLPTLFKRRYKSAYDLDAVVVIVVVETLAKKEGIRVDHRLRIEEIMLLERDTPFEFLDDHFFGLCEHLLGNVLDHETQGLEVLNGDVSTQSFRTGDKQPTRASSIEIWPLPPPTSTIFP